MSKKQDINKFTDILVLLTNATDLSMFLDEEWNYLCESSLSSDQGPTKDKIIYRLNEEGIKKFVDNHSYVEFGEAAADAGTRYDIGAKYFYYKKSEKGDELVFFRNLKDEASPLDFNALASWLSFKFTVEEVKDILEHENEAYLEESKRAKTKKAMLDWIDNTNNVDRIADLWNERCLAVEGKDSKRFIFFNAPECREEFIDTYGLDAYIKGIKNSSWDYDVIGSYKFFYYDDAENEIEGFCYCDSLEEAFMGVNTSELLADYLVDHYTIEQLKEKIQED